MCEIESLVFYLVDQPDVLKSAVYYLMPSNFTKLQQ